MAERVDFELTKPVGVAKDQENLAAEVRDLKTILTAEANATETYKLVIKNLPDFDGCKDLKAILAEHKKAVEFWRIQLRSKDIHIKDSPQAWPAIIDALSIAEDPEWQNTILEALLRGEQNGLSEYEELALNGNVNFQSLSFIKNICLDQQRKHLAILEGLRITTGH